jgi:hypothetical protein
MQPLSIGEDAITSAEGLVGSPKEATSRTIITIDFQAPPLSSIRCFSRCLLDSYGEVVEDVLLDFFDERGA